MENTILQAYKTKQTNRTAQIAEDNVVTVPVIMMVEGVHNGSHGRVLHTNEGLSAAASDWNGMPVVIFHPQDTEGHYISANSTGIVHVGKLTNARFEDGRLRADAVIQVDTLLSQNPACHEAIMKGYPIDVSIGAYTEAVEEAGEWNGEVYDRIATSYLPDHLALLPGEEGACNWQDGCGVRVNSKQNQNSNNNQKGGQMKEKIMELLAMGLNVYALKGEEGYQATMSKAYSLINSLDSDAFYHYMEEVFDNVIIYRRTARNIPSRPERMFQQEYTIDANGNIELVGDPIPVAKTVSYKTIENNSKQKEGEKEMTKEERVAALIANGKGFTKCDESMLLQANEEQLAVYEASGKPAPKAELNDDVVRAYIAAAGDNMRNLLPEPVKQMIVNAENEAIARRKDKVEKIMANSSAWTEEDLTAMNDTMLDKLLNTVIAQQADYSGIPGAGFHTNRVQSDIDGVEPLRIN
jgi:hypothetical protein